MRVRERASECVLELNLQATTGATGERRREERDAGERLVEGARVGEKRRKRAAPDLITSRENVYRHHPFS